MEVAMKKRARLSLVLAMLLTAAAACGDDGSKDRASPSSCPPSATPGTSQTAPSGIVCVGTETPAQSATEGRGTYKYTLTQPLPQASGTQIQNAELVIQLTADGDNVQGTINGPTRQQLTQPVCPSGTVTPGRTTAQVNGTKTDQVLELHVVSASWQRPQVEACPAGGLPGLLGETIPSGLVGFEPSLSRLEERNGAYRLDRTDTHDGGGYPYTVEYHIEVRFEPR
jgi:hypothetical protein